MAPEHETKTTIFYSSAFQVAIYLQLNQQRINLSTYSTPSPLLKQLSDYPLAPDPKPHLEDDKPGKHGKEKEYDGETYFRVF